MKEEFENKKLNNGLTVTKSGEIYKGWEVCKVGNCISDGDLDMCVPIEPFVEYEVHHRQWKRYEWKRINVDKLMARTTTG